MKSYMPQGVFNMCAVTVAACHDSEKVSVEEFAKFISGEYRRDYIDDDFEKDIVVAAYKIVALVQK